MCSKVIRSFWIRERQLIFSYREGCCSRAYSLVRFPRSMLCIVLIIILVFQTKLIGYGFQPTLGFKNSPSLDLYQLLRCCLYLRPLLRLKLG